MSIHLPRMYSTQSTSLTCRLMHTNFQNVWLFIYATKKIVSCQSWNILNVGTRKLRQLYSQIWCKSELLCYANECCITDWTKQKIGLWGPAYDLLWCQQYPRLFSGWLLTTKMDIHIWPATGTDSDQQFMCKCDKLVINMWKKPVQILQYFDVCGLQNDNIFHQTGSISHSHNLNFNVDYNEVHKNVFQNIYGNFSLSWQDFHTVGCTRESVDIYFARNNSPPDWLVDINSRDATSSAFVESKSNCTIL
jgi:hypothetical protein